VTTGTEIVVVCDRIAEIISRVVVFVVCAVVMAEDSGNYTCQIDGPLNTVIGAVTHSVSVTSLYLLLLFSLV